MSIWSDLQNKRITFAQAAAEFGNWASQLVSKDPTLTQAAGETVSVLKQGASDAIMLADTALGPHILPAAAAAEVALDAALAKATGGVSIPFNPIINAAIDQIAGVVKNAADAWALQAKAKLAGNDLAIPAHPAE